MTLSSLEKLFTVHYSSCVLRCNRHSRTCLSYSEVISCNFCMKWARIRFNDLRKLLRNAFLCTFSQSAADTSIDDFRVQFHVYGRKLCTDANLDCDFHVV